MVPAVTGAGAVNVTWTSPFVVEMLLAGIGIREEVAQSRRSATQPGGSGGAG